MHREDTNKTGQHKAAKAVSEMSQHDYNGIALVGSELNALSSYLACYIKHLQLFSPNHTRI